MVNRSIESSGIEKELAKQKAAFSNFNMVRMREAMRYLSAPKLSLFISIPFYLHVNQAGLPGFVKAFPAPRGILDFRSSGFYEAGLKQGLPPESAAESMSGPPPCILGLYHIGSLGTFTQSAASDFDYWIIIDKTDFSPQRHRNFQQKLDDIIRHAREQFSQKVSFFVMDQAEIRQDCYKGLETRETLTAPKLFLKEEFYRTFLYIAGRIPLWAVLPPGKTEKRFQVVLEKNLAPASAKEFLGLGDVSPPERPDILKGILWHIVKSRADPVKALIKATMIFSHHYGDDSHTGLLCDTIKQSYNEAGIDDYRVDPYKILFDRIIAYHEIFEKDSLSLIKNAVFFRLCSFPDVRAPEDGSPKKQLLDRYIREWNLKPAQVKKILSYRHWSEKEKQLLENTFVSRLSQMYHRISKDVSQDSLNLDPTEQRNLTILFNKARERLSDEKGKIRPSSTYLRSQNFACLVMHKKPGKDWELSAAAREKSDPVHLFRSDTLLGLLGLVMENHLYRRTKGLLTLKTDRHLFESADSPSSPDAAYLRLQPAKPLSDDPFEYPAHWQKLLVLLSFASPGAGPERAEFLALNSWGGLFINHLDLDTTRPVHDRYEQITQTINQYPGETIRLYFFQLAFQREPEAVSQIRQHLDERFVSRPKPTDRPNRPLLDRL